MTNNATMILFYLRKNPEATARELVEMSGLDYVETRKALAELKQDKQIKFSKAYGGATIYLINNYHGNKKG